MRKNIGNPQKRTHILNENIRNVGRALGRASNRLR